MQNEQEQLDRDALLMQYAGGEMTAAQRLEFEAKLASDAELSAELQRLREAMARMEDSVRDLDERQRLPVNPAVAVRRVERAMQQWAVARLRPPESQTVPVKRLPWWSYPVAAAAVLIVSFIIWSGRQPILPTAPAPNFQNNYLLSDAEALADRLDEEFSDRESAAQDVTQVAADDPGAFFLHPAEVATW